MVSHELRIAATEVLEILKNTRKVDVNKIPPDFISYLEKISLKTYNKKFDFSKNVSELDLSPKTEALLGLINNKYWI